MGAIYAELHVGGHVFPVLKCTFGVHQATDRRGRVMEQVRFEPPTLLMDVPRGDFLMAWAAAAAKRLPADLIFFDAAGGPAVETLSFVTGAYCVDHREEFWAGEAGSGAYLLFLTLSDPDGYRLYAGGPASAFVAPAARDHGTPAALFGGAVATLPFVAGADGVPRLPRISGAPPFTVKGARNGKPGLDRGEFARQLTGQQDGLNRLTVAQFLANRDQYLKQALLTSDGRSPQGAAAQKAARENAMRQKINELRLANRGLTGEEAAKQAQQWLDTQAALHNPDQVAGGQADTITGLGDARVNSSIGAQWPKRIKAIDAHVRKHAAGMSPQQQQTTFLDVDLPLA